MAISGNNVYTVWWSNNTGNAEVMFRASNDNGQTFGDKINLSNSTDGTSFDAKIAASGDNVYIVWPKNQTAGVGSDIPIRISTDNGQTIGEITNLSNTIGTGSDRAGLEVSDDSVYVFTWCRDCSCISNIACSY